MGPGRKGGPSRWSRGPGWSQGSKYLVTAIFSSLLGLGGVFLVPERKTAKAPAAPAASSPLRKWQRRAALGKRLHQRHPLLQTVIVAGAGSDSKVILVWPQMLPSPVEADDHRDVHRVGALRARRFPAHEGADHSLMVSSCLRRCGSPSATGSNSASADSDRFLRRRHAAPL